MLEVPDAFYLIEEKFTRKVSTVSAVLELRNVLAQSPSVCRHALSILPVAQISPATGNGHIELVSAPCLIFSSIKGNMRCGTRLSTANTPYVCPDL